jgi:predicted HAD superfamily hydrolase
MNSWDLFDTLIGRWYGDPISIFFEVERRADFPGFVKIRRDSELELYPLGKNVTLDDIYLNFQKKTGVTDEKMKELMALELEMELLMSFPITKNSKRVQKGDIVVSDMYLPKDFMETLLEKNGIGPVSDIYVASGGKGSGNIWPIVHQKFRPEIHTGDNKWSDCDMPRRRGIRTACYEDVKSEGETLLEKEGFQRIANLSRALRLSCPYTGSSEKLVWDEQATISIPILILVSLYIPLIYSGKRVLMSTRD